MIADDLLSVDDLLSYVRNEGWLGQQVVAHASVGSTNDEAQAAAEADAPAGLVVIADVQTAGRGRLRRHWNAPPGSSLLCSMVFRPPAPFAYYASRTTMAVGLALAEAVRAVAGVEAALKWPNDLIVTGDPAAGSVPGWYKLAGMLSEVVLGSDGEPAALVVGVGLNVNVTVEAARELGPHASSLLALTGRRVSRVALLAHLLGAAERRIDALRGGVDSWTEWRAALAWLGQPVEVLGPDGPVVGIAEDVDSEGALMVRTGDGVSLRFAAGDVTLRPGRGAP